MESKTIKYSFIFINAAFFGLNTGFFFSNLIEDANILVINFIYTKIFFVILFSVIGFCLLDKVLKEEPGFSKNKISDDIKRETLSVIDIDEKEVDNNLKKMISKKLELLLANQKYPINTVFDFSERIKHLIEISSKDFSLGSLVKQYEIAVENERFYEKTIWQIAAILVPVSLSLFSFGFGKEINIVQIFAGILVYIFFLLLFNRFRLSIRLFREYAVFLEHVLGFFGHTFVYKLHFNAFGSLIRVWTILVFFGILYVNFFLYIVFNN